MQERVTLNSSTPLTCTNRKGWEPHAFKSMSTSCTHGHACTHIHTPAPYCFFTVVPHVLQKLHPRSVRGSWACCQCQAVGLLESHLQPTIEHAKKKHQFLPSSIHAQVNFRKPKPKVTVYKQCNKKQVSRESSSKQSLQSKHSLKSSTFQQTGWKGVLQESSVLLTLCGLVALLGWRSNCW